MSFERVQLLAAARIRSRAKLVLDLSQAIVAGSGDKKAWREKQQRLIRDLAAGL